MGESDWSAPEVLSAPCSPRKWGESVASGVGSVMMVRSPRRVGGWVFFRCTYSGAVDVLPTQVGMIPG